MKPFTGDGATRTLLAVMRLQQSQPTVTVRDVAAVTGKSVSTAFFHLHRLRAEGLVHWVDGQTSTLRATVERVS